MKCIKKLKNGIKKTVTAATLATVAVSSTANAAIADSKIATGFTNLLNDVSAWLMGISVGVGIAMLTFCMIRKGMADEQDQKKWTDKAKISVICAVGGVVAGIVITTVTSYFQ